MAKTGGEVQQDIFRLLKDSTLAKQLSGGVYNDPEMRPRNSYKEDALVIFTEGQAAQVESGTVTVDIYVPDIDPFENGVFIKDKQRTDEIEKLAQEWFDSLTADRTGYKFRLTQAIYTEAEPTIQQHFVVVKLGYDYFSG